MDFYKMLYKYYDKLFPISNETYNFLKSFVDLESKILDIGSATGAYVNMFRHDGFEAVGLEYLSEFAKGYTVIMGDMHCLPFKKESFNFIYSIGNTLVHAKSRGDFCKIVTDCIELLKPQGVFLFQILNYGRILENRIDELPEINADDGEVRFKRRYCYSDPGKIKFIGEISIKGDCYNSDIDLIPITMDEIKWVANKAGVRFVQFFGDFDGSKFIKDDSFMLIPVFYK
ncbi:MAG: class I SAM-dependent methyltransferase [Calditerrivibrio sp.]|nr:class I SAM-dependent methyltransferase [Calditerrivibrio sp.]